MFSKLNGNCLSIVGIATTGCGCVVLNYFIRLEFVTKFAGWKTDLTEIVNLQRLLNVVTGRNIEQLGWFKCDKRFYFNLCGLK